MRGDAEWYGAIPISPPVDSAGPMANPETTSPVSGGQPAGKMPLFAQAGFWIVALVAVAIGLAHVSIRFG